MKKFPLLLACLLCVELSAQISPPGLDDTNTAVWGAVGFLQNFGKKWSTTFYVGTSFDSNPNNISPIQRPAIAVINQESLYKFNNHWQIALCTSYRTQNEYNEENPFEASDPSLRKEIRYYLRMYYRNTILKKGSIYYAFRPEYRTFFDHWDPWSPVAVELRLRYKAQASYPINESKSNQIVVGNEILTTTDDVKDGAGHSHWSHYKMTEDRFTTYFKHIFSKPEVILNVGIMHQIKTDHQYIAHLAFDVIWQNPFSKKI